jgi:hypothetical protein
MAGEPKPSIDHPINVNLQYKRHPLKHHWDNHATGLISDCTELECQEYASFMRAEITPLPKVIHDERYGDRLEGCEIACMGVGHVTGCPNHGRKVREPLSRYCAAHPKNLIPCEVCVEQLKHTARWATDIAAVERARWGKRSGQFVPPGAPSNPTEGQIFTSEYGLSYLWRIAEDLQAGGVWEFMPPPIGTKPQPFLPPGWPKHWVAPHEKAPKDGQKHWHAGKLYVFYTDTNDGDKWKEVEVKYTDRYPFAHHVSIEDANEIIVLRDMPYPQSMSVHLANEHGLNNNWKDDQHQHAQAHLYGKFRDGAQHFHTQESR